MSKLPLATVVIPAYNVSEYIGECLESLLSQSYRDMEILVVDDGSTDGTADIVRRYANADSRITLFCNDNHGVSYSRNYAIERGAGDYLLFVDADDVVSSDFVEALARPLSDGMCEMSAVGIAAFFGGAPAFSTGVGHIYNNDEKYRACLDVCSGFAWNKGFLYYIIRDNNIRFDQSIAQSEDMLFLLDYLGHCSAIAFDDGVKYGYRQRRESAANYQRSIKWFDAIKVYEAYENRLGANAELRDVVRRVFLPIAYEAVWRYRSCGIDDEALCRRIHSMRASCERALPACSLPFRLKMYAYRHFMGAEMFRRRLVTR